MVFLLSQPLATISLRRFQQRLTHQETRQNEGNHDLILIAGQYLASPLSST